MSARRDLFSARDILVHLNNLVVMSQKPRSLGHDIPPARMRKLHSYSSAILEPLMEHLDEELLEPEELVFVLLACAITVQSSRVVKTSKVPGAQIADLVVGKRNG